MAAPRVPSLARERFAMSECFPSARTDRYILGSGYQGCHGRHDVDYTVAAIALPFQRCGHVELNTLVKGRRYIRHAIFR